MENTTKDNSFPADLSAEDIKKLKSGSDIEQVLVIKVDGKKAFFRNATMKTISAARAQTKPEDFHKVIATNCFIAGDRDLVDNPKYFHHIRPQLDELIYWFEVEVEKY